MHWLNSVRKRVMIASLLTLSAIMGFAQSDRGTLAGTILDSSGAVVSGAAITVTGAETGTVYNAVSSSSGAYRIQDMKLGAYNVKVAVTGFKSAERTGVVIQVNTVSSLDITLATGDVKETMTIVADAPTIQTESSDIGTVVSARQIQDLPLSLSASSQSKLRSPETFVFLTPGTAGPGTNSDHASGGTFETKLGGGQNFATEVLLDGVSTQRAESGSAFDQTAPSVEALSEFKVTTSTIPAEFGRTTGGVESFATKSGGNRFHGTAFNFFRNDKLDANSWNNNLNGAPKPRDHQNDFGGSLGGPIWIPKVYNGRDRSFFFFSWEQYRNRPGTSVVSTLPTADERSGNFSALLGADTGQINPCDGSHVFLGEIFDPATSNPDPNGQPCHTAFKDSNGVPNNIIPTDRMSGVALKILNFLPTGGANGACQGIICQNFLFNSSKSDYDTTMTFRLDHTIGANHKLFFSYSSRDQEELNSNPTFPGPIDTNFFNSNFTHYLRFGYDYAIRPTLLNHFVVGLNRLANSSKAVGVVGTDWDKFLGIGNASGQTFPQFEFDGSPQQVGYSSFGASNFDRNIPSSLVLADSVSWIKGRHSLRFGFEARAYQYSRINEGTSSPFYKFTNFETGYMPFSSVSGDPFASFLLGVPDRATLTVFSVHPRFNSKYYAFYAQDDFRVLPSLMLNLGLRYSVDTPRHEAHNAQSVLDLTAPNPGVDGAPGAFIYGSNATGAKTYYKAFAPRIGFSFAPSRLRNIVFRGGYSIYYAPFFYSDFGGSFGGDFTSATTASPNFESTDGFTPVQSLDQGFPSYPPPSDSQDPARSIGTSDRVSYAAASYGKPGMVQNWSFEFQHELAKDLILNIGYVGAHSTRLHSGLLEINSVNPKFYGLGTDLNLPISDPKAQADITQLGITVPSWFESLWEPSGNDQLGQLLRPFPQYRNIDSSTLENVGQSTYNAMLVKAERRFRNGLNLLASYTWSKTLTNADSSLPVFSGFNSNVFGAQNAFNLKGEKAVSYQDVPHTFVLSYLYELPAGPGKRFFNHGVASKVLGGWQVGGVHRYQSGAPVMIHAPFGDPSNGTHFSNGTFRLSQIPGVPLISPNASHFDPFGADSGCKEDPLGSGTFTSRSDNNFFNCAALLDVNAPVLVAARGYAFGNMPLFFSGIRAPRYINEDFSIIKRTVLAETQAITFKVDLPNAFNRHSFGQLGSTADDTAFGVPGGGGHSVVNAARQIQLTLRYEF